MAMANHWWAPASSIVGKSLAKIMHLQGLKIDTIAAVAEIVVQAQAETSGINPSETTRDMIQSLWTLAMEQQGKLCLRQEVR